MPEITISTEPTGANAPAGTPAEKKEETLILGKFKTHADLEKSYVELEKKLGAPKPEGTPAPKPDVTIETPAGGDKIDLDALAAEAAKNPEGKLSADTLKKLESKGIDQRIVDNYIAGQKAMAEQFANTIAVVAGGREEMDTVREWGKTALSQTEKDAFNKACTEGNAEIAKTLMRGFVDKYIQANGKTPNLVKGESAPTGTGEVFESMAQVTAAMRNPLYKSDPAFRRKVAEKLERSTL